MIKSTLRLSVVAAFAMAVSLAPTTSRVSAADDPALGPVVGQWTITPQGLVLLIQELDGKLRGAINLRGVTRPLDTITFDTSARRIHFHYPAGNQTFDGTVGSATMQGTVTQGSSKSNFKAYRDDAKNPDLSSIFGAASGGTGSTGRVAAAPTPTPTPPPRACPTGFKASDFRTVSSGGVSFVTFSCTSDAITCPPGYEGPSYAAGTLRFNPGYDGASGAFTFTCVVSQRR